MKSIHSVKINPQNGNSHKERKAIQFMKSTPTSRAERNDPQEREDLIREITKKLKHLDLKTLAQVNWNLSRKWGA